MIFRQIGEHTNIFFLCFFNVILSCPRIFSECLLWWKFQGFICSKFLTFCNHRCKSIRSHILFNRIVISVVFFKKKHHRFSQEISFYTLFLKIYVLLDIIYYVFFIISRYRKIPHQIPLMLQKNPSCVMWPPVVWYACHNTALYCHGVL